MGDYSEYMSGAEVYSRSRFPKATGIGLWAFLIVRKHRARIIYFASTHD